MLQEATQRIQKMEQCFDALLEAEERNPDALREDTALREMLQALIGYYESEQWQQDYGLDEAGLLPRDLKRGVLSQDAVFDFLERRGNPACKEDV